MLAGIWVETAKHTFSLDNLKYVNMRQRRNIILLLAVFAFVFAFVKAVISFDITRQLLTHLEFFRRILTLDAPKLAVSRLFSD